VANDHDHTRFWPSQTPRNIKLKEKGNCCRRQQRPDIGLADERLNDPEENYYSDEDKHPEDGKIGPCGYSTGIHEGKITHQNHQLTRVRKKRWPTDVPCLILFILFCIGMVVVGVGSFVLGNPSRLYQPTDYLGRLCGADNRNVTNGWLKIPLDPDCIEAQNNPKNTTAANLCEQKVAPYKIDLTAQKYLWFMDFADPLTYGGVCVSYCPNSDSTLPECPPELNLTTIYDPVTGKIPVGKFCGYTRVDNPNIFPPSYNLQVASAVLKYQQILYRCVPIVGNINSTSLNTTQLANSVLTDATFITAQLWTDLWRSWKVLVLSVFIGVVVSFVLLGLIRMFTDIMVWGSLLFCGLAISGLAIILIYEGYTQKTIMANEQLSTTLPDVIMYTGVGVGVIAILYFFLLIFLALRIRTAVGIIKEASKAVSYLPQLVLLPIVKSVILTLLAAWWITVAIFLFSYGTPTIQQYTVRYTLSKVTQGIFAYHLFGGLWISQFLIALSYMIVASCIASWYWSRKKRLNVLGFPIWKAIIRVLLYHTGTVAFGSLIVAIIQFIRILFEKMVREIDAAHKGGRIVSGCIWYVRIVLWIFEKIVKYINKNAYIQTAMYGSSFICAARDAMALILRNPIQIGVITTMGNIVIFISRLSIGFITAIIAYALATKTTFLIDNPSDPISSPILVAAIAFVIGFLIGCLFMVILETAIDTITQCYLIDREMCSDPNYEPYGTGSLRRYLKERLAYESARHFACKICLCFDDENSPAQTEAKTPVSAVEENTSL
jgi:choline transporter-like protein 2/4/5